MIKADWIAKLKEKALELYNEGGDFLVECYDQEDWEDFVNDVDTYEEAEELMLKVIGIKNERRNDIQAEIF